MTRWLMLTFALGGLGLGAWALLSARGTTRSEIDASSEAALEQVLRDAGEESP
jgi:hypothetical protein